MGNVRVYIGDDDFLISEKVKKLIPKDAGLEVIDSRTSRNEELRLKDIRSVMDSISAPPFLEPSKVTWWKNVGFLPGSGKNDGDEEKVSEGVKEQLAKFVEWLTKISMPDNQQFILSGTHLLKTSLLAKRLMAVAEIAYFGGGKPYEIVQQATARVKEMASEMGLTFKGAALTNFIATVGTDTRSLMSELNKMRNYLGDDAKTISEEDVQAISCAGFGVEPSLWAVTDAIQERNLAKALAAASQFEGTSGFAVMFTTVVEKLFRQMIAVATKRTDGMSPWAVSKIQNNLRHWRLNELRIARWRFVTLREKVVSGLTSVDTVVINEMIRTLG